ncbi:MAG: hypothetical protein IT480_01295 [Gammaproteobacteria bacterium]|nr:hypothetical protein [Gammaproteobacteria bacterium]
MSRPTIFAQSPGEVCCRPVFNAIARPPCQPGAATAARYGVLATCAATAALLPRAIERVHSRVGKVRPPADGPVSLAPLPPEPPRAADGRTLSVEGRRIIDAAIVDGVAAPSWLAALEAGYAAFAATACTAAAREGISAARDRRVPRPPWRNRPQRSP